MNHPTERDERAREPTLGDTVDSAVRRIVTAFVIGSAAVALAIYSRPGPPRYQVEVTDTGIVRIDTRRGTVIGCEGRRCYTIVRRGQRLEREPVPKALPAAPPAPAAKALPAPSAAPTAPAPPPAPAAPATP